MHLTYGVEESAFRAAPARENAGKSRPLVATGSIPKSATSAPNLWATVQESVPTSDASDYAITQARATGIMLRSKKIQ